jgi:hypothetical protein
MYCGVNGHTDRVLYNANLYRRPYVGVAFAQSASANTGRILPATEREDHETIKGKSTYCSFSVVWFGSSLPPCSTER